VQVKSSGASLCDVMKKYAGQTIFRPLAMGQSRGWRVTVLTHEPGKACQKRPTQKIFSIKGLVTRQCF